MAYAIVIWGFAPNGLAANSARDVGGRLAALTLWGSDASGGRYAAIAALTNIPAMLLAALFYEIFFHDSSRGTFVLINSIPFEASVLTMIIHPVLPPAQRDFLYGHKAHEEHRENAHGRSPERPLSDTGSTQKADIEHHA